MQQHIQRPFFHNAVEVKVKHTFRVNVFGRGYILLAGEEFQYEEFPLDVQSYGISNNFLSAQRRIDRIMAKLNTPRWYFSIANLYANELPVVAYGCFLSSEDEKGRIGISFIHAVEVDSNSRLDEVMACIVRLLSQQNIDEISKLLSNLAKGLSTLDEVIRFLTNQFNSSYRRLTIQPLSKAQAINSIQHDCGGASAVAWLAMASSHFNIPVPWEIYEEYSSYSGLIITKSSYTGSLKQYLLSEYLHKAINFYELAQNQNVSYPVTRQNTSDSLDKISSIPQEHNHRSIDPVDAEQQLSRKHNYRESVQPLNLSRQPSSTYSDSSQDRSNNFAFEFKELCSFELVLTETSRKEYRINTRRIHELIYIEKLNCYKLIFFKGWFIFKQPVQILLSATGLNDGQKRDLNHLSSIVLSARNTLLW